MKTKEEEKEQLGLTKERNYPKEKKTTLKTLR